MTLRERFILWSGDGGRHSLMVNFSDQYDMLNEGQCSEADHTHTHTHLEDLLLLTSKWVTWPVCLLDKGHTGPSVPPLIEAILRSSLGLVQINDHHFTDHHHWSPSVRSRWSWWRWNEWVIWTMVRWCWHCKSPAGIELLLVQDLLLGSRVTPPSWPDILLRWALRQLVLLTYLLAVLMSTTPHLAIAHILFAWDIHPPARASWLVFNSSAMPWL